jgi:adenosylhomocysteine nucleosidase
MTGVEGDIIGIVTGLVSEADLIRRLAARHIVDGSVLVECEGPGPDRAAIAAQRLIFNGATALASVGLAGGLKLSLWPGTAVIARTVIGSGGGRYHADPQWHRGLIAPLIGDDEVVDGDLVESATPVISAADKKALFDASGASAVDMESGAVAVAAEKAGVPFVAIRAIADPAELAIPKSALSALGVDGSVSPAKALLQGLSRPYEIPALLRLGLYSRRAKATLGRILVRTAFLTCMDDVIEEA